MIVSYYAGDYNGSVPSVYNMGNNYNFLDTLALLYNIKKYSANDPVKSKPYLERSIFRCPSHPTGSSSPAAGYMGGTINTSYGLNHFAFHQTTGQERCKLWQLIQPTKIVLNGDNYSHAMLAHTVEAPSPDLYNSGAIAFRHGNYKYAVFAFGDGHTESRDRKNVPCYQGYPGLNPNVTIFWAGNFLLQPQFLNF